MYENPDARMERDRYAVANVANSAIALLQGFERWIEDELIDLVPKAQQASALSGELSKECKEAVEHMKYIEKYQFPEARENLRTKIREINAEAYDHVIDARYFLEEGISRLELIIRLLTDYRGLVDGV